MTGVVKIRLSLVIRFALTKPKEVGQRKNHELQPILQVILTMFEMLMNTMTI